MGGIKGWSEHRENASCLGLRVVGSDVRASCRSIQYIGLAVPRGSVWQNRDSSTGKDARSDTRRTDEEGEERKRKEGEKEREREKKKNDWYKNFVATVHEGPSTRPTRSTFPTSTLTAKRCERGFEVKTNRQGLPRPRDRRRHGSPAYLEERGVEVIGREPLLRGRYGDNAEHAALAHLVLVGHFSKRVSEVLARKRDDRHSTQLFQIVVTYPQNLAVSLLCLPRLEFGWHPIRVELRFSLHSKTNKGKHEQPQQQRQL